MVSYTPRNQSGGSQKTQAGPAIPLPSNVENARGLWLGISTKTMSTDATSAICIITATRAKRRGPDECKPGGLNRGDRCHHEDGQPDGATANPAMVPTTLVGRSRPPSETP